MKKINVLIFALIAAGLFVIFSQMLFMSANVFAPVNPIFSLNSTTNYDGTNGTHGIFYLNWTNKSIVNSYKIYVTTNGSTSGVSAVVLDNSSHSIASGAATLKAGVIYKNVTEANYTFKVQAIDSGNKSNSTIAWIYYDATDPVIKVHNSTGDYYNNASSFRNNISTLTLNVSVSDAVSGVTNSMCIFDINGTNETIALSNGWCNSSQLNLTNLANGNRTIKIWVNDTVNNLGLNSSFIVHMDTTNPSPSESCSDVSIGDNFPCTCSGSDANSGVSSNTGSSNSPDGTSMPTLTGSFTYTCITTDKAGNSASTTCIYLVAGASNNEGPGGGSILGFWTKGTLAISETQFQEGYTKKIVAKQRVRVKIEGNDHHVGVKEISGNTVKIEVSSDPQEANLAVGDSRKFDVTGDGLYDIMVTLNGIVDSSADLTIKGISEEITKETEKEEKEKEKAAAGEEPEGTSKITWIIIIILVIAAFIGAGIAKKKKR